MSLYSDLDDSFNGVVTSELSRLQKLVPELELQLLTKEATIKKMLDQNAILLCNISILFKTAKEEIARKDGHIASLRELLRKNGIGNENAFVPTIKVDLPRSDLNCVPEKNSIATVNKHDENYGSDKIGSDHKNGKKYLDQKSRRHRSRSREPQQDSAHRSRFRNRN